MNEGVPADPGEERAEPQTAVGGNTAAPGEDPGESADAAEGRPADPQLPEALRRRVLQLAASVLVRLKPNEVVGPLRPMRGWRPDRIAKAAGDQLAAALHADHGFRELLAAQLLASDPLAEQVAAGEVPGAADPVQVGALAYLLRPAGWQELLAVGAAGRGVSGREDAPGAEALRRQLAVAQDKARRQAERAAKQLAQAKKSAQEDRQQLVARVERLTAERDSLRGQLQAAVEESARLAEEAKQAQAQVRRLKGQVADAAERAASGRAAVRSEKLAGNARLRVLLETLQEAAAGLAAEIDLPTGTPLPGDLVSAVAPGEEPRRLRLESAEELADALTAPRAHLILDGYNVTKTGWAGGTLSEQRDRLLRLLAPLPSRTGAEITVVFDGADVGPVPSVTSSGVRVRFSPPGEKADRVIVDLARQEPPGRMVVVVSSDQAVASGARNAGARSVGSELLLRLLGVAG